MMSQHNNVPEHNQLAARVTFIRSAGKANKSYHEEDGKLMKTAIGTITKGEAKTISVPSAHEMSKALKSITNKDNIVVCPGAFQGANDQDFNITTESDLAKQVGVHVGDASLGGVQEVNGRRLAARVKRGIDHSPWVLFDADNPPGIPDEWADMNIQARMELWEPLLPGLSNCERIELRASSARVRQSDDTPQPASHAWLRVSNPELIEVMKAHLETEMVLQSLSFDFEKRSRINPSEVVGVERRSVFDLAVFVTGRLVFCSKPDLQQSAIEAGYIVDDADIRIVNEGGGELDISWVKVPARNRLNDYKNETGRDVSVKLSGGSLITSNRDQLTLGTEIESKGLVKPLRAWLADMKAGDKLRCESPFRESNSEAAFISVCDYGMLVHDVGNSTNYYLEEEENKKWLRAGASHVLDGLFVHPPVDVVTEEPVGDGAPVAHSAALDIDKLGDVAGKVEEGDSKALSAVVDAIALIDNPLDVDRVKKVLLARSVVKPRLLDQSIKYAKKKQAAALSTGAMPAEFDSFNETHAVVRVEGKTAIMDNETFKPATVYDARNYNCNQFIRIPGQDMPVPLFDYWMKHPDRTTCSAAVFDPMLLPGICGSTFNMYRGMSVEPVEGDWSLIENHLLNIWCGGNTKVYEYLLNWVARMVQMPWEPAGSIITLGDKAEGSGTGIITDIFMEWFKHHSIASVRREDVTGRFNSKLAMSIFVLMNEAVWGGYKQEQGVLKALATDPYHTMELKGLEKITVKNCTHIITTSNEAWHSPLGRDDRRYLTLECSDARKGDQAYFNALGKQIASGGSAAFLHAMLKHNISGFHPGTIPVHATAQRAELKLRSMSMEEQWVVEVVANGDTTAKEVWTSCGLERTTWLEPGGLYGANKVDWRLTPLHVPKNQARDDCAEYTKRNTSTTILTKVLIKMLGVNPQHRPSRGAKRVYEFPPLPVCKQKIIDYMGGDDPF